MTSHPFAFAQADAALPPFPLAVQRTGALC
jgi:hypothetical protein